MTDALFIFLATVAADIGWARYISEVSDKRAIRGGLWSAALTVLSLVVTLHVVSEPWMLVPAGLGAFVGTLLGTPQD